MGNAKSYYNVLVEHNDGKEYGFGPFDTWWQAKKAVGNLGNVKRYVIEKHIGTIESPRFSIIIENSYGEKYIYGTYKTKTAAKRARGDIDRTFVRDIRIREIKSAF
jgi:hypothetical protein